jgi:hypothetical protein
VADLVEDGDDLVVRLSLLEKLGAFRRRDLRVPRSSVREVRTTERPFAEVRGMRVSGTAFPGLLLLGRWQRKEGLDFAAVYRGRQAVVIDLGDEAWPWVRLVVSVQDANETKRRLSAA